jgi:glucan 1,3-beta-glucosidase
MDKFADKAHHKFSKFLKKLEDRFSESGDSASSSVSDEAWNGQISLQDVYRYRKQRGVNLGECIVLLCVLLLTSVADEGSWFTLERWISESPFQSAQHPGQSDFDVASGPGAKQVLEKHWDTWITDVDWAWLSDHGINTVRIPVSISPSNELATTARVTQRPC